MSRLAIYLLGSPRIERDTMLIDVDTRKAIALIAYLAVSQQRLGTATKLLSEHNCLFSLSLLGRGLG